MGRVGWCRSTRSLTSQSQVKHAKGEPNSVVNGRLSTESVRDVHPEQHDGESECAPYKSTMSRRGEVEAERS